MTLAHLLDSDRVIPNLQATEHWPAILELVDHLIKGGYYPAEHRETILEALRQREEQQSTGIGGGVAIPHCFSDDIDDVVTVFGRSEKGVDFSALDLALVHFIVLFVVPRDKYTSHLQTLAAIAKLLNSAEVRNRLAEAEGSEEIMEVLSRPAATAAG